MYELCRRGVAVLWGQLGVMIFVMISSWFMADRQGICGQKIIMLLLQVWTTCILEIVAIGIWHPERLSKGIILKELLTPLYQKHYWFISVYLVFLIIVPPMQLLVQALSDHSLQSVCLMMTVLIPLYNYYSDNVGGALADFCYIFLVVAYLKRKPDNWLRRNCSCFWIGIAAIAGCLIGYKLLLSPKLGDGLLLRILSLRGRTLLLFLVAVELFYCFEKMKPFTSRIINAISGTMFGVYLIHENLMIRGEVNGSSFIWNDLLHIDDLYMEQPFFVMYYIGIVLAVFAGCILLEFLRQNLIERLYRSNPMVKSFGERFDIFYTGKIFKQTD